MLTAGTRALDMQTFRENLASGLRILGDGVTELLWPTRCVICDAPGTLLCRQCRLSLPYIDRLRACPNCGQANGKHACVDCNSFIVHERNPGSLESSEMLEGADQVVSAISFTGGCCKLVTTFKDRKEVRLAAVLAELMAPYIDPNWIEDSAIVAIPAREQAIRERGFDHMEEVGKHLSRLCDLPLLDLLKVNPGVRKDQRGLSATSRKQNMNDSFVPTKAAWRLESQAESLPKCVVLVDDVFTTGATIAAGASALKKLGVKHVYGLTLARLP